MRYNICILVLLLFVLSGCEKEINLEHMRPEPKLVLNCLAVQGDTLSVELSRTWFYADNKVKDIFVSGADVKLYVNDVFRESLSEVAVKYEELDIDAVRYKSSSYIPVTGDRIRLVASRNGFKDVEAVTEVPRPCSVSGFELQQESVRDTTEWFDDAYIHLAQNNTVCFTLHDEPGEDNYYLIYFRQGNIWGGENDTVYLNPAKRKAMVAKNEKRFLKQKRNVLQKSESLSFRSDYPVKIQASFKRLLKAV